MSDLFLIGVCLFNVAMCVLNICVSEEKSGWVHSLLGWLVATLGSVHLYIL